MSDPSRRTFASTQTLAAPWARRAVLVALSLAGAGALWAAGAGPAVAVGVLIAGTVVALLPGLPRETRRDTPLAAPLQVPFAPLLEAMPSPAVLLDSFGIVLAFNERAGELHPNLRRASHISIALRHPDVVAAVARAGAGDMARQTVAYAERVPVERHLEVSLAWLEGVPRQPRAPALLMVMRDLSEDDRLSRLRADFIANASHELRTPLASVVGFIETLQGPARNDPDARDRFLGIMNAQSQRMTRLIDNLLSLSRVEMREHIRPQGAVDLGELRAHVIGALEPLASEHRIALEAAGNPAAIVTGDRDELTQMLQNLVQNAIKYSHDGGRVVISLAQPEDEPGRVAVTVADDGIGIAAEHLPRLTERFYRVSGVERAGTGLGLAIVKHVVLRHRGEVRIRSALGAGSTFSVLLPRDHGKPHQ